MTTTITVFQMNRDLAVAQGIANDQEHSFPTADVSFVGYSGEAGQRGIMAVKQLWEYHCYEPVAVLDMVESTDVSGALDIAFTLTNSIDRPWYADGVCPPAVRTVRKGAGYRSTSVGDIMLIVTTGRTSTPVRRLYAVASCGFERLQ